MERNFPPTQDSVDGKETLLSFNEKERPEKESIDRIGAKSSSQGMFCDGNIILSSTQRESIKEREGTPLNTGK